MAQDFPRVLRWLQENKRISVPDDWLEACIEWVFSENEVSKFIGYVTKSDQKTDADEQLFDAMPHKNHVETLRSLGIKGNLLRKNVHLLNKIMKVFVNGRLSDFTKVQQDAV